MVVNFFEEKQNATVVSWDKPIAIDNYGPDGIREEKGV